MYYFDKPIIVPVNVASTYLYTNVPYSVYFGNTLIYSGVTFATSTTFNLDLTNVIRSKFFGSVLKPVYSPVYGDFRPATGVYTIDDSTAFYKASFRVYIYGVYTSFEVCAISNNYITADAEINYDFTFTNYLYTSLSKKAIPRYPNIVTNNYWFAGVYNVNTSSTSNYYLCTNRNYYIPIDASSTATNYFVLPLSEVYNVLPVVSELQDDENNDTYTYNHIITGGLSLRTTNNTIAGGSSSTSPTNTFKGGSSSSNYPLINPSGSIITADLSTENYTFYIGNDAYINSTSRFPYKEKYARIDKCNSPYYLLYQCGNLGCFSWGFDGNSSRRIERTSDTINGWYIESESNARNTTNYSLSTGILNEAEYIAVGSILTADYIYCYCPATDKGEYVKIVSNDISIEDYRRGRVRSIKLELKGVNLY